MRCYSVRDLGYQTNFHCRRFFWTVGWPELDNNLLGFEGTYEMIPSEIPYFSGRENEMTAIDELIAAQSPKPILISGIGGIGKTSLVSQFARSRFKSEKIFWISMYDSPSILENMFSEIRKNPPGLIVIDGVDEAKGTSGIELVSQVMASNINVPVITTSRYAIDKFDADSINIGPLTLHDSVELLRKNNSKGTDNELETIASELGNHPLAISMVSSLLKNRSAKELLREIRSRLYELKEKDTTLIKVVQPKIVTASENIVQNLKNRPNDIYRISPRSFEELIAELLDDMGWDVHLTTQTRDGGRDILAYLNTDIGKILCLVEAKRYGRDKPVGVSVIRNLYGTLCDEQANNAMLVTTSYFTSDARNFRARHSYMLSLKEYDDVVAWISRYRNKP